MKATIFLSALAVATAGASNIGRAPGQQAREAGAQGTAEVVASTTCTDSTSADTSTTFSALGIVISSSEYPAINSDSTITSKFMSTSTLMATVAPTQPSTAPTTLSAQSGFHVGSDTPVVSETSSALGSFDTPSSSQDSTVIVDVTMTIFPSTLTKVISVSTVYPSTVTEAVSTGPVIPGPSGGPTTRFTSVTTSSLYSSTITLAIVSVSSATPSSVTASFQTPASMVSVMSTTSSENTPSNTIATESSTFPTSTASSSSAPIISVVISVTSAMVIPDSSSASASTMSQSASASVSASANISFIPVASEVSTSSDCGCLSGHITTMTVWNSTTKTITVKPLTTSCLSTITSTLSVEPLTPSSLASIPSSLASTTSSLASISSTSTASADYAPVPTSTTSSAIGIFTSSASTSQHSSFSISNSTSFVPTPMSAINTYSTLTYADSLMPSMPWMAQPTTTYNTYTSTSTSYPFTTSVMYNGTGTSGEAKSHGGGESKSYLLALAMSIFGLLVFV